MDSPTKQSPIPSRASVSLRIGPLPVQLAIPTFLPVQIPFLDAPVRRSSYRIQIDQVDTTEARREREAASHVQ